MKIAPGESPFWGQGPHFGLHNTDYTPWVAKDDPSYLAEGIIVLDANNRMLAGSCIEDESPLKSVPEVKVTYNDARGDNSASHLYITLADWSCFQNPKRVPSFWKFRAFLIRNTEI